jgi:alkanesulfonate monooxygenase SsuD/methylene tetrahydromethanopterin reductase-like flavin-dependent oxidoreductase (luciferase family)
MGDRDRSMKYGLLTMQDRPLSELFTEWRLAEEAGVHSLWVADHFVNPVDAHSDWFDGWTLLAALATMTSRVRIGTLVSSMTLRNPVYLAREALTIDHLSQGRVEVGVGAGRVINDHRMTGVPEWSPAERVARFDEFLTVMRSMLDNEVTSFEGAHYRADGATMSPSWVQTPAPPLVVGAIGPRMIGLAARHADVWNTMGGRNVSAEQAQTDTRDRVRLFEEGCHEAGRDPATVRRTFLAFSHYVEQDLWSSHDAFADFVGLHAELGFDEIIFDMPPPASRRRVFEVIGHAVGYSDTSSGGPL